MTNDLTPDLAHAAAIEAAALECVSYAKGLIEDNGRYWMETTLPDSIRDLHTDASRAALDEIRRQERNKALKEAAYIASNACLVPPDGGSPTEAEVAVCDEARRRILAIMEDQTDD